MGTETQTDVALTQDTETQNTASPQDTATQNTASPQDTEIQSTTSQDTETQSTTSQDTPPQNTKPQKITPDFGELVSAHSQKPGIALAQNLSSDIMGSSSFEADGKPDSKIRILAHSNSPIVGVLVQNMGGKKASWKTNDVKLEALGTLMLQVDGKLINAENSSFSLDVQEPVVIELYLQDNGALADAKTRLRVVLFHADKSYSYAFIKRI